MCSSFQPPSVFVVVNKCYRLQIALVGRYDCRRSRSIEGYWRGYLLCLLYVSDLYCARQNISFLEGIFFFQFFFIFFDIVRRKCLFMKRG